VFHPVSEIISKDDLLRLVDQWIGQGKRAAGPTRIKSDVVLYAPVQSSSGLQLDGFIRPRNSIKEFIFPRHEKLYGYKLEGRKIELCDVEPAVTEQLVIGSRPCDAAAFPILDHVFNWDFKDEFYNRRRQATTIVTLACKEWDKNCFCTSVGLGPAAEAGSDAMLLDLGDGLFEVRCLTDKGKTLFAGKTRTSDKTGTVPPGPKKIFEKESIDAFFAGGYENPAWQQMTLRCLGCAACAFTCPTCHCFDIVDEGNAAGGTRAKNWDACQFCMFTAHASGHNPRTSQGQRQRQRIYHKFEVYPGKFGEILCTGCGNCTRNCPVELGVRPVLETIETFSVAGGTKA
jgi:ferredoxin